MSSLSALCSSCHSYAVGGQLKAERALWGNVYRRSLPLSPSSLPSFFFLREFFCRALPSERLEQAKLQLALFSVRRLIAGYSWGPGGLWHGDLKKGLGRFRKHRSKIHQNICKRHISDLHVISPVFSLSRSPRNCLRSPWKTKIDKITFVLSPAKTYEIGATVEPLYNRAPNGFVPQNIGSSAKVLMAEIESFGKSDISLLGSR